MMEGLIPVVAQDRSTGRVLMVAYMNGEALARTRETGFAWYWSRSRARLWKKGEESGHVQRVREIRQDCDGDALLLLVDQEGPACHTGNASCFFRDPDGAPRPEALPPAFVLGELEQVLRSRHDRPQPGSYTSRLFSEGVDAIGAKITEEAEEVVRAAKSEGHRRVVEEAADVIFHLMTLLAHQGVGLDEVFAELSSRRR